MTNRSLLLLTMLVASAMGHGAQNEPTPPAFTLPETVFDAAGEHWWYRPKDVRFVRLLACGGGGGGGGGAHVIHSLRRGGGGGAGAQVYDVMVGPLTAEKYKVTVGEGGVGGGTYVGRQGVDGVGSAGQAGTATIFSGADGTSFIASPGIGGHGGIVRRDLLLAGSLSTPAPALADGQAMGGGADQPGGRTPYAEGGSSTSGSQSGGGGGGIGKGGDAGAVNAAGANGALCAGGGGAGVLLNYNLTPPTGGKGGDGFAMIVPLVSADSVQRDVERLLGEIEAAADRARAGAKERDGA